jgi:hypothetical protein
MPRTPPPYKKWWQVDYLPAVFSQKEKIVEEAGYRTTKQMVNELQLAGERYDAFRRSEYYDLPEGSNLDDVDLPPMRMRNFDLADASRLQADLEARFAAHREEQKNKPPEALPEKAPEAPQAPQEPPKPAKPIDI